MISIIIPAYNEERYLAATLEAIRAALGAIAESEIIVADNESTDRTSEIAVRFGAKVVGEREHNIGRVRNTGAADASGELLIFIGQPSVSWVDTTKRSLWVRTSNFIGGWTAPTTSHPTASRTAPRDYWRTTRIQRPKDLVSKRKKIAFHLIRSWTQFKNHKSVRSSGIRHASLGWASASLVP